jgi:glutathione S-transferase
MRYQDQVVKLTQRAVEDLARAAEAFPADRLEWSPGGEARSALDQLREIAMSAAWLRPIVERGDSDVFEAHPAGKPGPRRMPDTPELTTVAESLKQARKSTAQLCKVIAAVPDGHLEDEVSLPFLGGTVVTLADVLLMHYWNLTYHLGQINQLALMLGDREMH